MLASTDKLLQLAAFFLRQPPCPDRLGQTATHSRQPISPPLRVRCYQQLLTDVTRRVADPVNVRGQRTSRSPCAQLSHEPSRSVASPGRYSMRCTGSGGRNNGHSCCTRTQNIVCRESTGHVPGSPLPA